MYAKQYEITLPADYDMRIIRNRVAEFGHLLDDHPGLRAARRTALDRAGDRGRAGSGLRLPRDVRLLRAGCERFNSGVVAERIETVDVPLAVRQRLRDWIAYHHER
ncbi:DUF4865 family protein [Plantactinospora sp. BB1]|uniref:DUF4865 family protein n=1 Tax=Plantactinospora sp. BB1 TaxID=2071627 RepID=UPI001F3819FE|nr:DUF4865 family protein [Plantactinospora sp. BB1]